MTHTPGSTLAILEEVDRAIATGFPGTPLATKLIVKAARFAHEKHLKQRRKGPAGLPYIVHPIDVAVLLTWAGQEERTIAAGFLHDVVEDCEVDNREVAALFGMEVAQLVEQVTNVTAPPGTNRAQRQAMQRERYAYAWPEARNLKLADTYCNCRSIIVDEPKFAPTYLAEKRLLLPVIKNGSHPVLYQLAAEVVGLAA